MQYRFSFKKGFFVFDFKNQKMIFKSEQALSKELNPLDLQIDSIILNLANWYIAAVGILYNMFNVKAEYRIPTEDFHMELKPFAYKKEAILKVVNEQRRQGYAYRLSKLNIYAFKEMLEEIDKIIEIQGIIAKKEGRNTYIEDIFLPFQVKKNLKQIIKERVFNKNYIPYFFTFENGRIEVEKRRIRFFIGIDGNYYLRKTLNINAFDLIKLMMVL